MGLFFPKVFIWYNSPLESKLKKMEQEQFQEQESEKKYILQHDRPNCIGCAACEAVAPSFWEMNVDGKSDIKGAANKENGWQELELMEKNFVENKDAADSCPVNVIHIVNKKTGERLV